MAIMEATPAICENISHGMGYDVYKGDWLVRLQKTHIGLYLRPPVIE